MKRITLYNLLNFIIIAMFFTSIIMQIYFPIFHLTLQNFWFMALCFFVSVSMLLRSIIFKSDSSLWLFVFLLLISVMLLCINIFNLPWQKFWVMAFTIIAVASFSVGIVFKEIYQIKIATILTLISVPFYLFYFDILGFWWSLAILIISLWLSIMTSWFLPERWYANTPKRK